MSDETFRASDSPVLREFLEKLEQRPVRQSLEPVKKYLSERITLPPDLQVVQVVGSNGKGSTVHLLDQLLRAEDKITVAYTSPHLVQPGERVSVNGTGLTVTEFVRHLRDFTDDWRLTPFEKMFLMAVREACSKRADYLLLEAGMGGRWDATSALPADWTVCTGVELEHTEFLGETREEILAEMMGQVPAESGLVSVKLGAGCEQLLQEIIREKNLNGIVQETEGSVEEKLKQLVGRFYREINPDLHPDQLDEIIKKLDLPPGRQSLRRVGDRRVLFDVAHTPAALNQLFENLPDLPDGGNWKLVYGSLEGKDVESMLKIISREVEPGNLYFTTPPSPRALPAEELQQVWPGRPVTTCRPEAVDEEVISQLKSESGLIVAGSFKLVGWFYKHWNLKI